VSAARRGGHGLVNAVLRRAAREGPALLAALDDETPQRAAIKHSHPEWIARMWWEELGPVNARALMAFDNEPAELALRTNTLVSGPAELAAALTRAGAQAQRPGAAADGAVRTQFRGDPVIPEALVVEGPFDVHGSPQWRAGAFIAQSRAAMLPARILGPRPGERVLDLCAAPGGKTTHLAALMGDSGEVIAVERDPRRAEELRRTVRRLHADCARIVVADARRPLTGEGGGFDRVLVDPPCSGLGTLQARADLRWRATPERMRELTGVQRAILTSGAAAVRPGGVLVYSTCTISPAENERQIFDLLESNPRFVLDDLRDDPALGPPGRTHRLGTSAMDGRAVLTLPHRDRTAGFFIARLRREAG
jgi:16S rRNA (cytosine967-C5)-methyltransferase